MSGGGARVPLFWAGILVLFVGVLWALAGMLLPFVAGAVIAYVLDPVVDKLVGWGRFPRWLATSVALVGFVVLLVLVALLGLPLIQAQVVRLIHVLPNYVATLRRWIEPFLSDLAARLSPEDMERLRSALGQFGGDAVSWLGSFAQRLLAGGLAVFDVLSVLFITPVVAFYLLRDWDRVLVSIDGRLPRPYVDVIREQAREIDRTLAGWMRGQATVCLSLGLFYAVALTLIGLDFGLIVGLLTGVLTLIPYVGTMFGCVASIGLALAQFDESWRVVLTAVVFIVGQMAEGNVLTPLLVGDRVGLHPVWVIFALLAGAHLMGFLGVLIAVPVAAIVGVLVRFGLSRYVAGPLYKGGDAG